MTMKHSMLARSSMLFFQMKILKTLRPWVSKNGATACMTRILRIMKCSMQPLQRITVHGRFRGCFCNNGGTVTKMSMFKRNISKRPPTCPYFEIKQ